MTTRVLLPRQPVTAKGDAASQELLEIIQGMARKIDAFEAKLSNAAAVTSPTGGGTIDAEARAAIIAIKAALT